MQIFYNNKSQVFTFPLTIDGVPVTGTTAQLILTVSNTVLNFVCTIDGEGNCTVTIPPLLNYNVLGKGNMVLQVTQGEEVWTAFQDVLDIQIPIDLAFGEFTTQTDYDSQDLTYLQSWRIKKPYNESPYLVLLGSKFNIAIGDTKPDLKFFVFKLGEQFGDPIPLPNMSSYVITIKVYDYNCNLIAFGPASSLDQLSGQITYTFTPFDFITDGIYFFEVEFKNPGGMVFTLPESNIKNEIIVRT